MLESVHESWRLTVAYAKQEMLEPLQGIGRLLVTGVIAAVAVSVGLLLWLLAILRVLQSETGSSFKGELSFLPYLITLVIALSALGIIVFWMVKHLFSTDEKGKESKGKPREDRKRA
ncbi:MAG: phage holin family protein [Actinobacteria bacterium]|nr:phage holin family protein [Actinomycetota bacterium]MCL6094251.1 phage holin family protein [Actinomycetota bacterium]